MNVSREKQPQCSTGRVAKIPFECHCETARDRQISLGWPHLSSSLQLFKFLPSRLKFCSCFGALHFPSLSPLGRNSKLSLESGNCNLRIWFYRHRQCLRRGRSGRSFNIWHVNVEAIRNQPALQGFPIRHRSTSCQAQEAWQNIDDIAATKLRVQEACEMLLYSNPCLYSIFTCKLRQACILHDRLACITEIDRIAIVHVGLLVAWMLVAVRFFFIIVVASVAVAAVAIDVVVVVVFGCCCHSLSLSRRVQTDK